MFQTRSPRFAKYLSESGPHAAARIGCAQVLALYVWAFGLIAVGFQLAGAWPVAVVCYVLAGVAALWGLVCSASVVRPRREYRERR